ncbi:glycosyltransferase family 2 protein [Aeromonas veronii]|uniref:glycosyltransferase family 2 protein n=1 Tax=Aeromonas veronii TaxID=654 RepID=UPI0038B54159
MSRVFFSVISHNHCDLIKRISSLGKLCGQLNFNVIVKSNTENDDFSSFQSAKNFHWLNSNYGLGFGANNNYVFKFCRDNLGMTEDDFFIVLNPDVEIEVDAIVTLISNMTTDDCVFASINLFKDPSFSLHDNSIRRFPNLFQFVKSFLGLGNDAVVNKSKIVHPCHVDWAAGSFLAFTAGHYQGLGGFDEHYFMYCEDIDICYRSHQVLTPLTFYPHIRAIHYARHENRKIFSVHFVWHLTSVFRFLFSKLGFTNSVTSI